MAGVSVAPYQVKNPYHMRKIRDPPWKAELFQIESPALPPSGEQPKKATAEDIHPGEDHNQLEANPNEPRDTHAYYSFCRPHSQL
jgi:hypothetical protein